jgi:hypothetical protein
MVEVVVTQRRDINTLSDADVDNYIHALNILRQRSAANPRDPSGYDMQARLHNDPRVGPCEHGSDLFLPWHRAHLYYFEKLLQESDPPRSANVTIPYWDWIHVDPAGRFPAAFGKPGLFENGRNTGGNYPLPSNTLEIVTTQHDWQRFGGYPKNSTEGDYGDLEDGPHNDMHSEYILGLMGNPATAARDPIYFSFHCFIDLLWAEWQRRNNMPTATSPNSDLRGFLAKPKHRVGDFQSTAALSYDYQYTEKLRTAFDVSPPVPERRELLATEKLQPLFEGSEAVQLREKAQLRYGFPSQPTTDGAAVVRLHQLKVPTTGSYTLRAYIHPKDVPFDQNAEELARRYFVGYAVMWLSHGNDGDHAGHDDHGGHAGHEHHPPQPHHPTTATVRFDVTKALGGVTSQAIGDQVLTLQYLPAPDPMGRSTPGPAALEDLTLNDVQMEVYG